MDSETSSLKKQIVISIITGIQPGKLHEIGDDLLRAGIIPQFEGYVPEAVGYDKSRAIPTQGQPDTVLMYGPTEGLKIAVAYSVEIDWKTKLKEDLNALKGTSFNHFVFFTNQNVTAFKKMGTKKPNVAEFCSSELGIPQDNIHVVGSNRLIDSTEDSRYIYIWRRHHVSTQYDFFIPADLFNIEFEKESSVQFQNQDEIDYLQISTKVLTQVESSKKRVFIISAPSLGNYNLLLRKQMGEAAASFSGEISSNLIDIVFNKNASNNHAEGILEVQSGQGHFIVIIQNVTINQSNLNMIKDCAIEFSKLGNKVIFLVQRDEESTLLDCLGDEICEVIKCEEYAAQITGVVDKSSLDEVSLDEFYETENLILEEYRVKSRVVTSIIYLLNPFNLRETETREKLRTLLDITETQENDIYEKLLNAEHIVRAGDVLIFKDNRVGQKIVDDTLLNNDKYKLEGIINKLELYE